LTAAGPAPRGGVLDPTDPGIN